MSDDGINQGIIEVRKEEEETKSRYNLIKLQILINTFSRSDQEGESNGRIIVNRTQEANPTYSMNSNKPSYMTLTRVDI